MRRCCLGVLVGVVVALAPARPEAEELAGSPRRVAETVPLPPQKVDEAVARWAEGSDRAVAGVRHAAQVRLGEAARELGRQDPFDWDEGSRRAAANRLAPAETSAALALAQERDTDSVQLARSVEDLARGPRRAAEDELARVEVVRVASRQACQQAQGCLEAAEVTAAEGRARVLEQLLATSGARFELLRQRVAHVLAERQRLAERVATATSDPFLLVQAKGLVANSWKAVAELAAEVEQETALAARLAVERAPGDG